MALTVFTVAFLLNFAWEVLQVFAYTSNRQLSMIEHLAFCVLAALADALFITAIYYVGRIALKDKTWITRLNAKSVCMVMLIGAIASLIVERVALSYGWWCYGPKMPQLFQVGLLPVVQLSLLPIVTFLIVRRLKQIY